MAARLGYALYWIGCGAAVAILAIGCVYGVQEDVSDMFADKVEGVVAFASVVLVAASIPWMIGWYCRYVLSGD